MDFVGGGARCSETASGGLKGSEKKIMRIFVKKIDQSLVKNCLVFGLFCGRPSARTQKMVSGHFKGVFTQFQPLL